MIRRIHAEQGGFTLMETLVGMVVGVTVLLGILSLSQTFMDVSNKTTRLVVTEDSQRRQLDAMTKILRNARVVTGYTAPVLRATATDLIIGTTDAPGAAAGLERLARYCVDTTGHELRHETAPTGSALPTACPSSWATASVSGATYNTATPGQELFTYDSPTLSAVTRIGIALRYNANTPTAQRMTTLRTAAAIRSLVGSTPQLTLGDVPYTCNGNDALLTLTLGAQLNQAVTATVYNSRGTPVGTITGTGTLSLGPNAQGALTVEIVNALGIKQTLFKTVAC